MESFPKPSQIVAFRQDRPVTEKGLKKFSEEGCPCGTVTYGIFVDQRFANEHDHFDIGQGIADESTKLAQWLHALNHTGQRDPHPPRIDLLKELP
jgi:hypothetical protein